ncbi:MAG: hypothetical protein ACLQIQ_07265 [Beijerinckiaceae bacterium]
MRAVIRPVAAAVSIACMTLLTVPVSVGSAVAQNKEAAPAAAPLKQMALTDKQIEGVIAAKAAIDAIFEKLPEGKTPDAKMIAQLDGVAKKNGFANYAEYDAVYNNIDLVFAGFDPQTKKYVGQEAVLKKQIAEVQADKSMPAKDKKEALDELNESLKSVTPLQFPASSEVVAKYYDKLSALQPQEQK